jgi:hypothetical protein
MTTAKPSLNRPPRSKRPPELVRHVDAWMDAYRRVVASGKEKRAALPAPGASEPTDR